jgi:hypothetical protein
LFISFLFANQEGQPRVPASGTCLPTLIDSYPTASPSLKLPWNLNFAPCSQQVINTFKKRDLCTSFAGWFADKSLYFTFRSVHLPRLPQTKSRRVICLRRQITTCYTSSAFLSHQHQSQIQQLQENQADISQASSCN